MKKSRPIRPFQIKVTLAMIFSLIFAGVMSNLLLYKFTLDSQFNGLRKQLMLIAQTAALVVDPHTLLQVPLTHEGVHSPQYQEISHNLKKIKDIDPKIEYVYILTKTQQDGIWQFMVDPDSIAATHREGMPSSLPGDQYNAARFPEMMKAFDGPAADKKLEIDEWGITLSGYAPIRDESGRTVAVLGVDIAAEDVYALQKAVYRRELMVLLSGILVSLLLGFLVSQRITRPVEKLVEGTRRIALGDLQHHVDISGEDEIGELANSFNLMSKSLHESRMKILGYFFSVVKTLVRILELRDQYTHGHSEKVAVYAGKIATRMGYPHETVKFFKRMTLLHDIGKLGIKDSILNKPGPLTEEEWEIMRQHTIIGEQILKPVLENDAMLSVVRGHHERYDGNGYPDKLDKDEINVFAAIVTVADAYEAMTSDRSYRKAMGKQAAIEELKRHTGTQFHPEIVRIFLEILKEDPKKA